MSAAPSASAGRSTPYSLPQRALAHHDVAWAAIVDIYVRLVYCECRARHAPEYDAPDVVQDVFRKVYLHLSHFRHDRPGYSFRTSVVMVTRNGISNYETTLVSAEQFPG